MLNIETKKVWLARIVNVIKITQLTFLNWFWCSLDKDKVGMEKQLTHNKEHNIKTC